MFLIPWKHVCLAYHSATCGGSTYCPSKNLQSNWRLRFQHKTLEGSQFSPQHQQLSRARGERAKCPLQHLSPAVDTEAAARPGWHGTNMAEPPSAQSPRSHAAQSSLLTPRHTACAHTSFCCTDSSLWHNLDLPDWYSYIYRPPTHLSELNSQVALPS